MHAASFQVQLATFKGRHAKANNAVSQRVLAHRPGLHSMSKGHVGDPEVGGSISSPRSAETESEGGVLRERL